MDQTGTPYDILDSSSTELTAGALRNAEGHGRYNGIVLTQADLYTPSGSGFTAEEWEALHAYEREFAVREAVVAGFPIFAPALGLDYGMGTVGAAATSTGRWVAPAGTGRLFSYVNTANTLDIPEYSVWGTPRGDASAPHATPLLVDEADASHVFVSQLDYADGRQVLLSTVGNAWYRLHSNVIAYQFLDWATKGLFIGARQVSLSAHTDDMFLADDLWDPAANVTDPNQQYRLSAADLDNVVAGQQAFRAQHPLAAGWKVQFPYNGSGASTAGPANPRVTKAVADDATLNKAQAGRNYGRATTSVTVSKSSTTESRAILRAANVAPPAGTVTKVFLNLRVTSNSAALPVQVCAVTESWVEGAGNGGVLDASGTTWNNRSGLSVLGTRWKTAGGTYAADRCVTATLPTTGAASIDITPIWQAWNSKAIANNGLLVRATANGSATLASAEASASTRPSIAIDSVGAPDGLTARAVQLKDQFGWINHTFNALQMDRLCPDPDEPQPAECPRTDYQTAYDDIAQNRVVWTNLALPGYQEGLQYLLSDSHAGLHDRMGTEEDASDDVPFPQGANPNFLQAAQDLGVRYIASDSSRPNQDKEQRVPGFDLILLPRYPTNVYVNATTPEQNVDEYNWIYHDRYVAQGQDPCSIPAAVCTTKTYDQLLAWEADTTVGHMLSGKAWPHYFHQSNLRNYGGGRTLETRLDERGDDPVRAALHAARADADRSRAGPGRRGPPRRRRVARAGLGRPGHRHRHPRGRRHRQAHGHRPRRRPGLRRPVGGQGHGRCVGDDVHRRGPGALDPGPAAGPAGAGRGRVGPGHRPDRGDAAERPRRDAPARARRAAGSAAGGWVTVGSHRFGPGPGSPGPGPRGRTPGCGPRRSSAGLAPGVELEVLADRRQAEATRLGAEGRRRQVVLGVEHGLVTVEEGPEHGALVELRALLDDGEVEGVGQLGHLVEVVLEADRPGRARGRGRRASG